MLLKEERGELITGPAWERPGNEASGRDALIRVGIGTWTGRKIKEIRGVIQRRVARKRRARDHEVRLSGSKGIRAAKQMRGVHRRITLGTVRKCIVRGRSIEIYGKHGDRARWVRTGSIT